MLPLQLPVPLLQQVLLKQQLPLLDHPEQAREEEHQLLVLQLLQVILPQLLQLGFLQLPLLRLEPHLRPPRPVHLPLLLRLVLLL